MVHTATTNPPEFGFTSPPVFGLRREIDRLFEDTFGGGQGRVSDWWPAVDIRETDQELTIAMELSGLTADDVEVMAENGILTVRGNKTPTPEEGQDSRYHLVERSYGSFMRRLQLPQGIDAHKISANVEHGLLLVHIPKTALPQPQRIHVNAGPRTGLNLAGNGNVKAPVVLKVPAALGRSEGGPKTVSAPHAATHVATPAVAHKAK